MSGQSISNNFEAVSSFTSCCTSLKWKLRNFSLCSLNEVEYFRSSPFSSGDATWVLRIYRKQLKLAVYIYLISSNWDTKNVKYKISLENKTGTDHCVHENESLLNTYTPSKPAYMEYWNSLTHDKREEFLPEDTLTVCCELKYVSDIQNSMTKLKEMSENNDEKEVDAEVKIDEKRSDDPEVKGVDRLVQNLKKLLIDEKSTDVLLKAEGREFRVHKTILIARSPVFASMFHHDTTEKTSGVVDIPACSAEAFEVFLMYLYSGSADTISVKNVYDLYYSADKYQVDDLKEECVEYMKKTLSLETFCDVISLSLRHSESNLKKTATRFFCENMKKIVKTVQWQKYMTENLTHANELIIKGINA